MRTFDLNCAPIDQYPVTMILTNSDLTTSELILPRYSLEEFIVPNMPRILRDRLTEDGSANIWVVDDENRQEHFLAMVYNDFIYSIISWNHVPESRPLREGQEIRFGWMDDKLHFIVLPEGIDGEEAYFADNDKSDEDYEHSAGNQQEGEQSPEKGADEKMAEPPAKKMKTDNCESSIEKTVDVNP